MSVTTLYTTKVQFNPETARASAETLRALNTTQVQFNRSAVAMQAIAGSALNTTKVQFNPVMQAFAQLGPIFEYH